MQTLMIFALIAWAQPVWDTPLASLILKDGTAIEATILKQDAQILVLEKTSGETVVVPKESIHNFVPFWSATLARSSLNLTLETSAPQPVEEIIRERAAPFGVQPVVSRDGNRLSVAVDGVEAELVPVFARLFTRQGKISFLQPSKQGIRWRKQAWGPAELNAEDLNDCRLEERGGVPEGEWEKGWRSYMVESLALTFTPEGAARFARLPRLLAIALDGRPFAIPEFLSREELSVRLKIDHPLEFAACFLSGPMPEVKVVSQELNFR